MKGESVVYIISSDMRISPNPTTKSQGKEISIRRGGLQEYVMCVYRQSLFAEISQPQLAVGWSVKFDPI